MGNIEYPLVCICIPAFNAESTISATLRSILGQTYPNIKVLVVDNHSTDATLARVQEIADPRVAVYRNSVNLGGEGNFNRCIELAEGKYTAIYHADDIYEPDIVSAQVDFLESYTEASAVFTDASIIDQYGRITGEIRQPASLERSGPLHGLSTIIEALMQHSNFLICPSVMALTKVYQHHIHAWRGDMFGSSADLDVWIRMLQYGPIGILPKLLMRYRISQSQWSARVRMDTDRAAFFTVLDYYLAKNEIRQFVSTKDLIHYSRLESRDKVMRSANALAKGMPEMAGDLCPDVFMRDVWAAAMSSKRGLVVLILSAYIKVMLILRLHSAAGAMLRYAKKLAQK